MHDLIGIEGRIYEGLEQNQGLHKLLLNREVRELCGGSTGHCRPTEPICRAEPKVLAHLQTGTPSSPGLSPPAAGGPTSSSTGSCSLLLLFSFLYI